MGAYHGCLQHESSFTDYAHTVRFVLIVFPLLSTVIENRLSLHVRYVILQQ